MNAPLLAASAFAACLVSPVSAQWSSQHTAPSAKAPATIAPLGGTIALTGSDDCSTPRIVSGPGPHAYDTSAASTGSQGQTNGACLFFGTPGISNDVWFEWTAGTSGNALLQTCGQTSTDSKVAVYAGSGCPGGAPLACNDDSCGLQTSLTFPVVAGNTYTIQVGVYPSAAGGPGSFTVNVVLPPGPCTPIDDGASNNSVGLTNGGAIAWLQRFGSASGPTTVTAIETAYGSPGASPSQNPADGTSVVAHIWDDPNDDGNPTDGVLLQSVPGVVTGTGTDQFATFNLAPAVTVNGYLFVGIEIVHAPGQFPAPLDQPANPSAGNAAWAVGNSSGVLDSSNLANNDVPPIAINTIGGLAGQWLLRVNCGGNAFTSFCEPGTLGVIACPCGNPGAPGNGCNNSANTGGAKLTGSGNPSLSNDTVSLTSAGELPTALTIFLQGDAQVPNGVQFGQGVRCAGGQLLRLYSLNASGGVATVPGGGPSVSARAIALGDTLTAGSTRYYHAYYRDPNVLGGCNPAFTWNVSQGLIVTWTP